MISAGLHQAHQVDAVDVLHREEVGLVDLTEVEELDDVGVVEAEADLRLGDELLDEAVASGERRVDLLEHDELLQALGGAGAGEVDLGHATRAQLADQLVFAEALGHDITLAA